MLRTSLTPNEQQAGVGEELKMKLEFKKDKETKNTVKYAEVTSKPANADGTPARPTVGSLYILKGDLGDLGEELVVTIENKEGK